jgi:hypothetical protein
MAEMPKEIFIDVRPLAWTTTKPTVPGFYWHRQSYHVGSYMCYFDDDEVHYTDGTVWNMNAEDGEWYGPLDPPV